MAFCGKCGTDILRSWSFCGKCGAPATKPGIKRCPGCHSEIDPTLDFCTHCGKQAEEKLPQVLAPQPATETRSEKALEIWGWIFAIGCALIPLLGVASVILAVILISRKKAGSGIGIILTSIVCFVINIALWMPVFRTDSSSTPPYTPSPSYSPPVYYHSPIIPQLAYNPPEYNHSHLPSVTPPAYTFPPVVAYSKAKRKTRPAVSPQKSHDCLDLARETYSSRWEVACKELGLDPDCHLSESFGDKLNRQESLWEAECEKKGTFDSYPIYGVSRSSDSGQRSDESYNSAVIILVSNGVSPTGESGSSDCLGIGLRDSSSGAYFVAEKCGGSMPFYEGEHVRYKISGDDVFVNDPSGNSYYLSRQQELQ